jgi:pimeloyl-ACP methyl ester carboxylesterase
MREWKMNLPDGQPAAPDFAPMWDLVAKVTAPITLYLGGRWSVVGPEDVEELRRLHPDVEVITVDDAGHSIQGDQPLVLAALLRERCL